jgi:hypothetical protein
VSTSERELFVDENGKYAGAVIYTTTHFKTLRKVTRAQAR